MATRTRRPRRGSAFTPFVQPTRPPAGTYDPALDAQEAAATRGLEDLRADTGTAGTRASNDFLLGQRDIGNARKGIETGYGRNLADLLTNRSRGEEDYGLSTQNLGRRYRIQGQNQLQAGNQAGLLGGGFQAQAARKRAENQGLEQSDLDRGISRFRQDSQLAESRLGEDKGLALGENDTALARLTLGYDRGTEDRTTALSRAEREGQFFSNDIGAQRFYEAASTGYVPPEKPRSEGTRSGVTYRRRSDGSFKLADGRIVDRRTLLGLIEDAKRRQGAAA